MTANSPANIMVELEDAVAACPQDRCARILDGILQLLTGSSDRSQELLANVVDGILLRLTERVDARALVQLGVALAELKVAPPATLRRLASNDDPAVACPVLVKSQALSTSDLETIAISGGERQQLAIATRACIESPLTETLIRRGGRTIHLALISNAGARFSDAAYVALLETCASDDELTKALALRPGTPDPVLRKLLSASPPPNVGAEPTSPPVPPSQQASQMPELPGPAAYASARPEIVALNRIGKLNDSTVNRFAIRGETANLFTALSVLSGAPIEIVERVMTDEDCEGIVMACRASRLNWQTTLAVLSNRSGIRLSYAQRKRAQHLFETLLLSTSQWTVRWGEIAARAGTGDPALRTAKSGGNR
ncbi:hypothetical protein TSA1_06815 [Bradyrhizobium nitroreducens]|uniref:DUF2336 domain-containing protein n=1 Tax=Bradyrhizobium nitroreducens TaxID=709803 RepID=A0A2M6U7E5_9BRAD|nr:DUF2336 domain-containing protein [Bradyrhizobium nitroreducens]PIT00502.1 hypothetical protein TSA1_06815 [Bradyrhizobium nitroreducens]